MVVFTETWEDNKLRCYVGGTAPTITNTAGDVFRGSYSLSMTTSGAQWNTSAWDFFLTPQLVKKDVLFGMACWFCYRAGSNAFELDLFLDDGTNRHQQNIRFNQAQARLEYYNAAGSYVAITGGSIANMAFGQYYWYYIKAVFDPTNNKYAWVLFNDKLIDLSSLSGKTAANTSRVITFGGQNTAQTAAVATTLADDLTFTIYEPSYAQLVASEIGKRLLI